MNLPSPSASIEFVRNSFPFPGYFEKKYLPKYVSTIEMIRNHSDLGSSILDFGSGAGEQIAMLSHQGFRCYACDDLQDSWHVEGDNTNLLKEFYQKHQVEFCHIQNGLPFSGMKFDLIMANHVFEHIHNSPRLLAVELLSRLKPGGLLLITVPNSVNLRKRIDVLRGRTNYPPYKDFFLHEGDVWRGHTREYSKGDLMQFAELLDLDVVKLMGVDHMLNKISGAKRLVHKMVSACFPFTKDSLLLLGRKQSEV